MSATWIGDLLSRLEARNVQLHEQPTPGFAPARLFVVKADDWGVLAHEAKNADCRWVAGWGEDTGEEILVNAAFEKNGAYLVARAPLKRAMPFLPSHTPYYPGADRPERHIQDMLGVAFTNHPDARRWTRHQAWREADCPLRKDFPAAGRVTGPTPPDDAYKFLYAQGAGVYEIPVGPIHAGTIEPGHFRFQAVGETVLNLEEHLGYTHKGIEKIAEGRDADGLARLAGRVSGDSTVAHAWAACMAMEKAAGIDVPARALYLRAIMSERERVANHLGDIGMILNDVAFTFGFYQFSRLREDWQRLSREALGHRFMMDRVVPGGVAANLSDQMAIAMQAQIAAMRPEIETLMGIADDTASVEDRLVTTGYLAPETAKAYGALGYVGKASGHGFDARRNAPYAPYDQLQVEVPVFKYGDVAARVKVRAQELLVSFGLLDKLLASLPDSPLCANWKMPAAGAEGLGVVEGWRGEIVTYVRFGADGKITRFFPRDPSWTIWQGLEKCIRDNIVPDFPVCNKSINGSYSGHDL